MANEWHSTSETAAGAQDMARFTRSVFEACGAVHSGHFRVPAGHHSSEFWDKSAVLQRPSTADALFRALADQLRKLRPDVVAGPANGGMIVAWGVARHLGCDAAFLERASSGEPFTLGRSHRIRPDRRVVLVDDILSSGNTLHTALRALEPVRPVGVGVVVDRSSALPGNRATLPLPQVVSLAAVGTPPVWDAEACPLCAAGVTLVDGRTLAAEEDR